MKQDKPVSFIKDVAPILKEHCFACHNSKKMHGKFCMTTFEKLMAGGVNGEAIVAGKPESSELFNLMISTDPRRMPPRNAGEAVPKEKAELVARWIKEGAKLDTGADPNAKFLTAEGNFRKAGAPNGGPPLLTTTEINIELPTDPQRFLQYDKSSPLFKAYKDQPVGAPPE